MQDIAVNDETSLEISIVSEINELQTVKYLFTFADIFHRSWGIICTTLSKEGFYHKIFQTTKFQKQISKVSTYKSIGMGITYKKRDSRLFATHFILYLKKYHKKIPPENSQRSH